MPSPEHAAVVEALRAAQADAPAERPTVAQLRQAMDALGASAPVPAGVTVEPVTVGAIPCERHVPAGSTGDRAVPIDGASSPRSSSAGPVPGSVRAGTIVYLHGGGHVAGSPASHRSLCARLALATGRTVLAVGHRRAPEHPHPAAVEDATAVVRALLAEGHDPGRIVVAGDSAGGGLAVATLLALADAGDPRPAGAVLLSPWLDLTLSNPSITAVAGSDPLLRADVLAANATAYAGGAPLTTAALSPGRAPVEALAALPPILVLTGTADLLVDDSRVFAERATAAGVTVELVVEDDLVHVWPLFDGLPESAAALERVAGWVDRRLTPPAPTPSPGFGFHATMTAQPGRADELVALLLGGPVDGPAADPACLVFLVGRSASDPDVVFLTEGWTTEAAHAEVFASEAAQAYMARFAPLVEGETTYADEIPLGGKPALSRGER